jgi:Protein of unknown function (DUF1045)
MTAEFAMSNLRYALYLAPPPESDLWRFGSDVIGRDAASDASIEGFAPEGYDPEGWRESTSEPRRYGFHMTLKAPFRLRADLDVVDLMDRVAAFARTRQPFAAGELHVSEMAADEGRGFVVLKPKGDLKALRSFEESAVRTLDSVRAPWTREECGRRSVSRLTPRQRYYLEAWGYPYVIDEFRPHFTLTSAIANAGRVAKALDWEFRLRIPSPALGVKALTLFGEKEPGGEFKVLRRFALGELAPARRTSPRVAAAVFID